MLLEIYYMQYHSMKNITADTYVYCHMSHVAPMSEDADVTQHPQSYPKVKVPKSVLNQISLQEYFLVIFFKKMYE